MYVRGNDRRSGQGRSLIEQIAERARAAECDVITANIFLEDPNASSTLIAAIRVGFKVVKGSDRTLLIAKELQR